MLSEKIANEIMTEMQEMVKDFVSDTIADRRSVGFDQIETRVSELKERFGRRLSEGALEAIGSGHIGQRLACKCGGSLGYESNRRWILISLNGKLEIYRAYYYCESCKTGSAPLDEQLGLEGKHHSIGVRKKVGLEAFSEPFAETSRRLEELIGIQVSSKESQLESEELGQEVGVQEDELVEAFWSEQVDIDIRYTGGFHDSEHFGKKLY